MGNRKQPNPCPNGPLPDPPPAPPRRTWESSNCKGNLNSSTRPSGDFNGRAVAGVGRVLAASHWIYTRDLLESAGIDVTPLHERLYTAALQHGYKHGREHGREDENAHQEGN